MSNTHHQGSSPRAEDPRGTERDNQDTVHSLDTTAFDTTIDTAHSQSGDTAASEMGTEVDFSAAQHDTTIDFDAATDTTLRADTALAPAGDTKQDALACPSADELRALARKPAADPRSPLWRHVQSCPQCRMTFGDLLDEPDSEDRQAAQARYDLDQTRLGNCPTPAELRNFVVWPLYDRYLPLELPAERYREIQQHLAAGCAVCNRRVRS